MIALLWALLGLAVIQSAALAWLVVVQLRLAAAVDLVDERVMEQLGGVGQTLADVHSLQKHPSPLHGPVK